MTSAMTLLVSQESPSSSTALSDAESLSIAACQQVDCCPSDPRTRSVKFVLDSSGSADSWVAATSRRLTLILLAEADAVAFALEQPI